MTEHWRWTTEEIGGTGEVGDFIQWDESRLLGTFLKPF